MASTIEWTDDTWNPVEGCSPVSPGCLNCYAAALASRGMCDAHKGLTRKAKRRNRAGRLVQLPVFNGRVNLQVPRLLEPVRRRKPTKWFVNSMSDLFHERVPFPYVAAVFGIAAACPDSTFQILTKRADRAAAFFPWLRAQASEHLKSPGRRAIDFALAYLDLLGIDGPIPLWRRVKREGFTEPPWPLPNVHLGVSAEDQKRWDIRVRELRHFEVGVRWVSIEPQIGSIQMLPPIEWRDEFGYVNQVSCPMHWIDWVVVGGESGPGARPFGVDWARDVVRQCDWRGVPVFVKQLGDRPFDRLSRTASWPRGTKWKPGYPFLLPVPRDLETPRDAQPEFERAREPILKRPKGGDPREWPRELRVRQWPRER